MTGVPERKTRHDGVVPVRPLIELLDLVPVLGLVQRLIWIEPRRRHEDEVRALIRPLHAARLERSAAPEHPSRHAALTAAGAKVARHPDEIAELVAAAVSK